MQCSTWQVQVISSGLQGWLLLHLTCSTFVHLQTIDEDGNCQERRAEHRNMNKRMSNMRRFACLIKSCIGHKVHRYNEVQGDGLYMIQGLGAVDMNSLYNPRPKESSISMLRIMGTKRTPQYPSPSPLNAVEHQADLSLMKHCYLADDWHKAGNSWLCILLRQRRILIRRKKLGTYGPEHKWLFPLGEMAGVAALAWPAVDVLESNDLSLLLSDEVTHPDQIEWLHILDVHDWEAALYLVLGPLESNIKHNTTHPGPACYIVHGLDTLIRIAAWDCFGTLPRVALVPIAQFIDCDHTSADSMHTLLFKMVRHCLPEQSEENHMDILAQRDVSEELYQDMLDEQAEECLDDDEQKDMSENRQRKAKQSNIKSVYHEDHMKAVQRLLAESRKSRRKVKYTLGEYEKNEANSEHIATIRCRLDCSSSKHDSPSRCIYLLRCCAL